MMRWPHNFCHLCGALPQDWEDPGQSLLEGDYQTDSEAWPNPAGGCFMDSMTLAKRLPA